MVVDDAPLIEDVRVGANRVPSTLRVHARQPQVPVDIQTHQIAGGFETLAPSLGDRVSEHELDYCIIGAA